MIRCRGRLITEFGMTKGKKIFIGVLSIVIVVAAVLLVMIFVYDSFGFFTAEYRLDYDKYVKVGEYKGLTYQKAEVEVTEEEIKAEIDRIVNGQATSKTVKKGKVKDGDSINISYVGTIDGKEFEGGSAENQDIVIGETLMIDGFTDGLIGAKVGKTVKLELQFPKDYDVNPDLAGKDVIFRVTVNSRQKVSKPEYNEEFVTKYTDYSTMEEFEQGLSRELWDQKEKAAEAEIREALWKKVVDSSEIIVLPEKQLAYEKDVVTRQYQKMAKSYGLPWADFLNTYMQSSEDDFAEQAAQYAETVVKQKLVMHSIAKTEGLSVSKAEYKEYLDQLLKDAGMDEKAFIEQYNETIEQYAEENDFKTSLLLEKVLDKVMEYGSEA